MKTLLILTAAIIGGVALPAAVMAGPTERITGCATVPIEGTNGTQRVDPNCALAENKDGSPLLAQVAAAKFIEAITPDEEEDAE